MQSGRNSPESTVHSPKSPEGSQILSGGFAPSGVEGQSPESTTQHNTSRRNTIRVLLVAAILPAAFAILYAYRPVCENGPVVCVSRLASGVPCPGCGLTRAFCFMTHGEFRQALEFNALAPFVAVYLLLLWAYYVVYAWRGKPPEWPTRGIAGTAMFVMAAYFAARLTIFFARADGLATIRHDNGIARLIQFLS